MTCPHFDITDFGATGDGTTLNTEAFAAAVRAAAESGGTVYVPPGTFLTGTIRLESYVTLELAAGAVILGSPDLKDYPEYEWGHHDDRLPYHLIYACGAQQVRITGDGEINGNGGHFHEPERPHAWAFYREIPMRPSPMVEIARCCDVKVEKVRLRNPGGWTLHLHDCDRAMVHAVTIDNCMFQPNSDGIDLTGCHDVMISDCFIRTGDDAVALKTTIDSRSCEHITVTNCVLETNCAAIRLGYESDQDFLNCCFSNITIKNCSRAIDLLTFAGGSIENCSFTNIVGRCMSGWLFDRPIEINSDFTTTPYKCEMPEHPNCGKVYPERPAGKIRGITITNFDVETCGRILIGAAPDARVEDISLAHVRLRYPLIDDPAQLGAKVGGKSFFGYCAALRSARAALVVQDVQDFRLSDFRVWWPDYPVDPDQVELLRSPNREANPEYFGDMDRVVRGENAPGFSAVWARRVTGMIDPRGLSGASGEVPALVLEDCELLE
ncbi:MAG: glycoside hydrolase family 28 protein [Opitutales bacterium]